MFVVELTRLTRFCRISGVEFVRPFHALRPREPLPKGYDS